MFTGTSTTDLNSKVQFKVIVAPMGQTGTVVLLETLTEVGDGTASEALM